MKVTLEIAKCGFSMKCSDKKAEILENTGFLGFGRCI